MACGAKRPPTRAACKATPRDADLARADNALGDVDRDRLRAAGQRCDRCTGLERRPPLQCEIRVPRHGLRALVERVLEGFGAVVAVARFLGEAPQDQTL